MDAVTALANAEVPGTKPMVTGLVGAADKSDGDRASKWARKKEKMLCYRCGEKGHFIAECATELCDTCLKPTHDTGECPILREQMPSITIYGVCCAELMFFESPSAREIPDDEDIPTMGTTPPTIKGPITKSHTMQIHDQVNANLSLSFDVENMVVPSPPLFLVELRCDIKEGQTHFSPCKTMFYGEETKLGTTKKQKRCWWT